MRFRRSRLGLASAGLFLLALVSAPSGRGQSSSSSRSSPGSHHAVADSALDPGSVTNHLYRNKTFGFTCRIPDGWVLRTDEMNAPDQDKDQSADRSAASSSGARVLLAAFSRPPAAQGEEVNSSLLIAAENASAYPGLKEAAQYFYPLTEVAQSQGFLPDEDPYEVAIGAKTLTRGDFHKDVGTRVMRQSTLAMLSHGYAISITVIAGTDDEVEDLMAGLEFAGPAKAR